MVNRLAAAVSPYLRQHAGNPVDWYPWGAEAFAEAPPGRAGHGLGRVRHVPLVPVMARESFSDPDIGALLARGSSR